MIKNKIKICLLTLLLSLQLSLSVFAMHNDDDRLDRLRVINSKIEGIAANNRITDGRKVRRITRFFNEANLIYESLDDENNQNTVRSSVDDYATLAAIITNADNPALGTIEDQIRAAIID